MLRGMCVVVGRAVGVVIGVAVRVVRGRVVGVVCGVEFGVVCGRVIGVVFEVVSGVGGGGAAVALASTLGFSLAGIIACRFLCVVTLASRIMSSRRVPIGSAVWVSMLPGSLDLVDSTCCAPGSCARVCIAIPFSSTVSYPCGAVLV